jgi:hypothetical protein
MTIAALVVANLFLLLGPGLYGSKRLGLLLIATGLFLGANGWLLIEASASFPVLACVVGGLFGVAPTVLLLVFLIDVKFGVFASDVFYCVILVIIGLMPLTPATDVVWLLARSAGG